MLNDQLNPVLLGRTHENIFIDGENPAGFHALLKSLLEDYTPSSLHEQALVEDAAILRWLFWRRQRAAQAHEADLFAKEADPAHWLRADFKDAKIAQDFKHPAGVSCRRAFSVLEAMRKEKIRTQRWELTFDLQKQRFALAQRKYDDIAPKIQAQTKLAVLKADESSNAYLRQQRDRACNGHKRPSVIQNIEVTVVNGITKTIKNPSNQDVMAELAARAPFVFPPEQIVREFKFRHSIPREYDWAAEDGDRSPADVTQFLSLEEWSRIMALEKEHCLPDPPDRA